MDWPDRGTTVAELAIFPRDCWVLIVEPESLQAMTLESLVDEFGCECMGSAGTLSEVEKLLHTHRPSFALVEVDIDDELGGRGLTSRS
jgi:hypothetical protein